MKLESLFQYLDEYLSTQEFPDYSGAHNGIQVQGGEEVTSVAAAVDASEVVIEEAISLGVQLLIVHHGLFWDVERRLTGPLYRKVKRLIEGQLALYASHLPLDAHAQVGNCAVVAREVGIDIQGGFGTFESVQIGWWGVFDEERDSLRERLEDVLGGPVRLIAGGQEHIRKVGVITGAAASSMQEAKAAGLDALITGEGSHHHFQEALETGINLYLGGHYATETWGVRALCAHLEKQFDLSWHFIDQPSGF